MPTLRFLQGLISKEAFSFATALADKPTNLQPNGTAYIKFTNNAGSWETQTVNFTWSGGTSNDIIQVCENGSFRGPTLRSEKASGIGSHTLTLKRGAGKQYYWRVFANGRSPSSDIATVKVDWAEPELAPASPAQAEVLPSPYDYIDWRTPSFSALYKANWFDRMSVVFDWDLKTIAGHTKPTVSSITYQIRRIGSVGTQYNLWHGGSQMSVGVGNGDSITIRNVDNFSCFIEAVSTGTTATLYDMYSIDCYFYLTNDHLSNAMVFFGKTVVVVERPRSGMYDLYVNDYDKSVHVQGSFKVEDLISSNCTNGAAFLNPGLDVDVEFGPSAGGNDWYLWMKVARNAGTDTWTISYVWTAAREKLPETDIYWQRICKAHSSGFSLLGFEADLSDWIVPIDQGTEHQVKLMRTETLSIPPEALIGKSPIDVPLGTSALQKVWRKIVEDNLEDDSTIPGAPSAENQVLITSDSSGKFPSSWKGVKAAVADALTNNGYVRRSGSVLYTTTGVEYYEVRRSGGDPLGGLLAFPSGTDVYASLLRPASGQGGIPYFDGSNWQILSLSPSEKCFLYWNGATIAKAVFSAADDKEVLTIIGSTPEFRNSWRKFASIAPAAIDGIKTPVGAGIPSWWKGSGYTQWDPTT